MFGKSEEDKKKDELKKLMEEQKKLEGATASEEKVDEKEEGLGGLKKIGSIFSGKKDEQGQKPPEKKEEEKKPAPEKLPDDKKHTPEEKPVAEKKPAPEEKPPAEKKTAPEEQPAAEKKPAPKPAAPKKKTDPEIEKLERQLETQKESMKSLEDEKGEAMKKSEELAGLVEDLSSEMKNAKPAPTPPQPVQPVQPAAPSIEPKIKELEEKTALQIDELKKAVVAMTEKEGEEKKGEQEVAETMKKMFDKRLKELGEKLEESKAAPPPKEEAPPAGEVASGLMAMSGGIEFKNELDKLKKSLKEIATLIDAFKEEAENRFMAIDRELETVERVPDLEDKMEDFERKLGAENVQKLRALISSADEMKEEIIPLIVKRKVEENIDPFSKRIKNVEDALDKANAKMNEIGNYFVTNKKDITALYRFDDRISKLEDGISDTKRLITELSSMIRDSVKANLKETDEKIKELLPRMIESESSSIKKEFAGRFAFIDDKLQSVENMVSESHKDIGEFAALKGEVGSLQDGLERLDEKKEKILNRIEILKSDNINLEDRVESLQTPKEIITELDNKTKDILDIREFFVRRADGLEKRINAQDERAVPTKKLHDKVDALSGQLKEMRESQMRLEQRIESEKKEFQQLVKHHAEEKRKLEERLKEQKLRVSTLLKEFR